MTTGVGTTLTMGYDGLRRLTSVTGGPVSRQYTYRDIDSTKTTMQVASVTSGGQQYGYTYDSMGNIATYSAPGKATVTYTYDNQGQLLKAVGDTTYTYTYDGAGNILTANGHTYTYGDANWKDLLTAFDGQSITYDSIGNPTSYYNGTNWDFTWANGRSLATASNGATSLSFAYDASGLRTSKTVNGTTYRYYYASGKLMRMTWGTNTIDFFYDANGAPYAMKYNGTVYYYVTNLQGDVMRIVNASGTVVASYDYDPYGKVISATGSLAGINPIRYRGYYYDTETGFYYLQSRYYDPTVGRFINADGYASTGRGIIGYNMYSYCGNKPISRIDASGSSWTMAVLIACVAAVLSGCSSNKSLDGHASTVPTADTVPSATEPATTAPSKNYRDFLNELGMRESSNIYSKKNQFGYLGRYQMGNLALQDAGFMNGAKEWTSTANSYGVYSEADFLNNPAAQDAAIAAYHTKVCGYIRNYGLDSYIGTVYCGVEVTRSGLLAACHLVGVGNMRDALPTGAIKYDGNGVPASQYMDLFGGYDISEVW